MSEQGVIDTVVEPVPQPPEETPKASPANDLRIIQTLLLEGVFAGKYAGMILASFKLLDHMAAQVEKAANDQAK